MARRRWRRWRRRENDAPPERALARPSLHFRQSAGAAPSRGTAVDLLAPSADNTCIPFAHSEKPMAAAALTPRLRLRARSKITWSFWVRINGVIPLRQDPASFDAD